LGHRIDILFNRITEEFSTVYEAVKTVILKRTTQLRIADVSSDGRFVVFLRVPGIFLRFFYMIVLKIQLLLYQEISTEKWFIAITISSRLSLRMGIMLYGYQMCQI